MRHIQNFLLLITFALPTGGQAAELHFFQVPPNGSGAMLRGAVW